MARSRSPLLHVFLWVPVGYLLAFVGFPVVYNLVASLQKVTVGNIADLVRPFVGLDNYVQVLADPAFRKVLVNSLVFVTQPSANTNGGVPFATQPVITAIDQSTNFVNGAPVVLANSRPHSSATVRGHTLRTHPGPTR